MMHSARCSYYSLALVAFLTLSATLQAQTPPSGGYTITTPIGLTGGNYQYTSGSGLYLYSDAIGSNQAGQATGYSNRYDTTGTVSLGQDSWLYNGVSTVQIGLTGANYQYTIAGSGAYQNSTPAQINSAGQVLGNSNRYDTTGNSLGYDAWVYNGTTTAQVGLTGANHGYAIAGSGTFQQSDVTQINSAGLAIGDTVRYSASGATLGYDGWLYNGVATTQIGLTGVNYQYNTSGGTYQFSSPNAINSSGQVIGFSMRYNASGGNLGYDAYIFSGGVSARVGLSGAAYQTTSIAGTFQYSDALLINDAGQVAGYSGRVSPSGMDSMGADSWLYSGGTPLQIGLIGGAYLSGGFQYSMPTLLNSAGQVTGFSYQDSWLYDGSATVQIGLTGGVYQFAYLGGGGGTYQSSSAIQVNSAGQVIGTSNRYNASSNPSLPTTLGTLGQDSWVYNGSSTVQIGLTGGVYQYAYTGVGGGTYQLSTPIQINSAGQVIGTSNRYNSSGGSLGQAGWYYNGSSTVALSFGSRNSDNYSYTAPTILTNQGVVLGSYESFSGTTDLGAHAFWWSQAAGFYDLGLLVNGGLTASGWASLANVYGGSIPGTQGLDISGSPLTVFGTGELTTMSGGQLVFELTAIPEPKWVLGLSALAACALALVWRSRRFFALRVQQVLPMA
jgi:hypothetical protein